MTNQSSILSGIFPCPVYIVKRNTNLSSKEEKEIGKIIEEGMKSNTGNSSSVNSYIFNGKLKNIKQFCEQQIKQYVEQVINPEEELDFHITQSWLNITKPGENHHSHFHSNSIISGVFYIFTEEDDKITFSDPNTKEKEIIKLEPKGYNVWNSSIWFFPVKNNELILFPSWLHHQVDVNEKATTDRISISFNIFVRGTLGKRNNKTELILK
tara:strand:+ start:81 stop:713 length:633 start_codon:yes stop_codon:yes gene_type:complete